VKLPNAENALVEDAKLLGYLLNPDHPHGTCYSSLPTDDLSFGRVNIQEHERVVLTADIPADGLEAGDVGTVVHIHRGGEAYEVEFMTLAGDTLAVATVLASQCRMASKRDVSHVRELVAA
jgi:hypothetical protein